MTTQYIHPCGQPIDIDTEHMVGYSASFVYYVNSQAVRECPRCGKRIWFAHLIHPDDMPKKADDTWEDYLDQQDTLASLRATP